MIVIIFQVPQIESAQNYCVFTRRIELVVNEKQKSLDISIPDLDYSENY